MLPDEVGAVVLFLRILLALLDGYQGNQLWEKAASVESIFLLLAVPGSYSCGVWVNHRIVIYTNLLSIGMLRNV